MIKYLSWQKAGTIFWLDFYNARISYQRTSLSEFDWRQKMNNENKFLNTKNVVYLAILTTLLIVFNLLGTVFKVITNVNLTLIPIALGALILGVRGGLILGLISGAMTFIFGVTALDPFTNFLFSVHPVITFLICIVKITVAGVVSGLIYKALNKKNKYVATFIASGIVPVINTGLFILGMFTMPETLNELAGAQGVSAVYYLIILCAGVNFLIEFAISLFLSPAIFTVNKVIEKNFSR